ncbi:MAG: alpha-hydroxy-acid oxidizing protein [Alphaproteobacteria bacterium]|nr:alpha-hydroxy-acid oxidizing protein [Alphaproteobacteria bacterium]
MGVETAINIAELREHARRRLPRMVFDYIDGGSDDEQTLARNTAAFRERELLFNVLAGVTDIDLSVEILGMKSPVPFILAPTAAQRLFHPRLGELAAARGAARFGAPYAVSTLATQPLDAIAGAHPGPRIFQVYVWKDRQLVADILDRVRAAGYGALALTVDAPVAGNRERDRRNGFTIPVSLNTKTVPQALSKPGYLLDLLLGGPAQPANFPLPHAGDVMTHINTQFDRSISWDYVCWLKDAWGGPLAIKGLSRPDDAVRAVEAGADAVWISNHGGRQLDTAPATLDTLPAIRDALKGRAQIILDGGITRGTDIVKALALGADAVAVGKAYLYGLAAGGEAGVARAVEILKNETERAMALVGRASVAELGKDVLAG